VPTDKKDRKEDDPPFLKISNSALKHVKRGWYREAVIEKKTTSGSKYKIQYSTWRDKNRLCLFTRSVSVPATVTPLNVIKMEMHED